MLLVLTKKKKKRGLEGINLKINHFKNRLGFRCMPSLVPPVIFMFYNHNFLFFILILIFSLLEILMHHIQNNVKVLTFQFSL